MSAWFDCADETQRTAGLAAATDGFSIEILGERRAAQREAQPVIDAPGARMRA